MAKYAGNVAFTHRIFKKRGVDETAIVLCRGRVRRFRRRMYPALR